MREPIVGNSRCFITRCWLRFLKKSIYKENSREGANCSNLPMVTQSQMDDPKFISLDPFLLRSSGILTVKTCQKRGVKVPVVTQKLRSQETCYLFLPLHTLLNEEIQAEKQFLEKRHRYSELLRLLNSK